MLIKKQEEDDKGNIIEDEEKILARYRQYFENLLTKKEPDDEEEADIEKDVQSRFEDLLRKAKNHPPPPITSEEVRQAVKKNKRGKAADRQGWRSEWLIEGGEEMIKSLVILYNTIQTTGWIPQQWNEVKIKSLHKKGPTSDLNNKRGIFLANILYKTFERIIIGRNEVQIEELLSNHQCGSRKGVSTVDNIMLMSALIERNKSLGKNTYIFYADAVKCFDKLWLKNCLLNMNRKGFPIYDTVLLYQLNHKAIISVNTPFGDTEDFTVYDVVKQGTISGPLICCSEVDEINNINEVVSVPYGPDMDIGMPEYVDDVSAAGDPSDIRKGIRNCREMEKYKFTYGLEKTKYMIVKTGKELPETITERVKEGIVQQTNQQKYVGIWMNEKANLTSHLKFLTDKTRVGLKELKSIGHESNVGKEAIRVKLHLYTTTVLKALTYNLHVWEGTTPKEMKELEKLQAESLKKILNLPNSTPYMGILVETGIWPVEQSIWYSKLMLYHNIIKGKETRLAKMIWKQQEKYQMPNSFHQNVQIICNTLQLNGDWRYIATLLKSTWKRTVKESIGRFSLQDFHQKQQTMTKLRFLKQEFWGRQQYIETCPSYLINRIMLIRLNMCPVKENFRSQYEDMLCRLCHRDKENTEHQLKCPAINTENIEPKELQQVEDNNIWKKITDKVATFSRKIEDITEAEPDTVDRDEEPQ